MNLLHTTGILDATCPLQIHAITEFGIVLVKIALGLLYGGE